MPLKKYNTTSTIIMPPSPYMMLMKPPSSSCSSPKSGTSTCSSPPDPLIEHNESNLGLAEQMSSLAKLVPSIIEAASSGNKSIGVDYGGLEKGNSLPAEIKSRLHSIFSQIEVEFDSLYAENVRLQRELYNSSNQKCNTDSPPPPTKLPPTNKFNTTGSSSSTLVATSQSQSPQKKPHQIEKSLSQPASLLSSVMANNTKNLETQKSATNSISSKTTAFSKTRINNLSFPKFRPNAREFILQSIKNTSAQIVNKTQMNNNSSVNSKLQHTLSGHRDGIWDINCLPIPDHLFNSNNLSNFGNNNNLLIGTASADSTARLWYLNSHNSMNCNSGNSNNMNTVVSNSQGNSPQTPSYVNSGSNGANLQTNGFCIQQYCGHTGSVNSIRFHPRFFTDATNLILTASGDSQAHIWQCVLSPVNDSLESTSEVVLNYNNCYSFATQNQNQNTFNSMNGLGSPPLSNNFISNNPIQSPNNNYKELISNTPIIRSPIKRFEGHTDVCIAADWFPDGELLATASWDRSANVYNVETGKVLCTLQHDDVLTNVNIHPVQKIILTSSKDTTFKVWDFRDPICSVNVYQGHNRSVNSAIFVNEDKIATSSDDQTVKLWDLRIMRSPVCTLNLNSGVNRLCTMKSSENSETYLCLPLDNRDVKIYNLAGERVMRLPRSNRAGHQRLVTSLTSHNNLLISASFDKNINCWLVDYNSQKAASTHNGTTNGSKFNFNNNKENNGTSFPTMTNGDIQNHQSNTNTPLSQIGLIPNEPSYDAVISSCPPAQTKSTSYESSPPHKRMSSSFYESPSSQLPPLTHITNNSGSNNVKNLKN